MRRSQTAATMIVSRRQCGRMCWWTDARLRARRNDARGPVCFIKAVFNRSIWWRILRATLRRSFRRIAARGRSTTNSQIERKRLPRRSTPLKRGCAGAEEVFDKPPKRAAWVAEAAIALKICPRVALTFGESPFILRVWKFVHAPPQPPPFLPVRCLGWRSWCNRSSMKSRRASCGKRRISIQRLKVM